MGKSWIIIGLTTVLAISLLVLAIGHQPVDSTQQNRSDAWMFKGAYATYEGQIEALSSPCSIDEKIQVTDLNATHVQIQTDSSIATSFSPKLSDQTTLWVNKTNINFQPKGETLTGTYSTQITLKSNGPRDCIVYDYINEGINASVYLDKVFLWPLRVVYTTAFENETYKIMFNLNETNIDGLS